MMLLDAVTKLRKRLRHWFYIQVLGKRTADNVIGTENYTFTTLERKRYKTLSEEDLKVLEELDNEGKPEVKQKQVSKKIRGESTLTVTLTDKTSCSWSLSPIEKDRYVQPWNKFKNWFHAKRTPYVTFHHVDGETCLARSEILRYEIRFSVSKDDKPS
jgi:hypothetical protein